jgi:hypothetical protein
MSETAPNQSSGFHDRSRSLIGVGIVQVFLGLLLVGLTAVGVVMQSRHPAPNAGIRLGFPAAFGAAALVCGIGSILRKNWGRIASLALSTFWLVAGVSALVMVLLVMPGMSGANGQIPPDRQKVILTSMVFVILLFYVALPAGFLVFYSRKSVRATCLAGLEPSRVRPTAIVILGSWLALIALFGIYGCLAVRPAILFAAVLRGPAGAVANFAVGVLFGYAAWGVWRQRIAGWKAALTLALLSTASTLMMVVRFDPVSLLREVGFAPGALPFDVTRLEQLGMLYAAAFAVVLPALVLYSRRHFSASAA